MSCAIIIILVYFCANEITCADMKMKFYILWKDWIYYENWNI